MADQSGHKYLTPYITGIITLGTLFTLVALFAVDTERFDIYLPMMAIVAIAVAPKVTIQIPRFRSHVTASDTLVFLAFLMYGGEVAVLLAAAEAFVSSWSFCRRRLTVFFNSATAAISIGTVYLILNLAEMTTRDQTHGRTGFFTDFVIVLSALAFGNFVVTTVIAALYDRFKSGLSIWENWKSKYVWTFLTYFIGAVGAGALVQMADAIGVMALFATIPMILFVFLTYRMYLSNVEISINQKEQAEQYAEAMESQSQALRESEEKFRSAFDYAPIGIGLVSPAGRWIEVNHALIQILGYDENEFLERDFQSMVLPDDLGPALVQVHEVLAGKAPNHQMEKRYRHSSGRTVWTSWSVSAAHAINGLQPDLIFQLQDITGRKSAEEKLQYEATHDALTGLPNRAFFMARLNEAIARKIENPAYQISVLFIDLDRFKYVNDSLGHLTGDQLLIEISHRLKECLRPTDLVARLGGDEFTILVLGRQTPEEVAQIAERIQVKFESPFDLSGNEIYSSASIGILNVTSQHADSAEVMRDADTAMYQAKRAGKARHEVFDDRMHSAAKEILKLETELRRAVERDEITVLYQPIIDLTDESVIGVESLARWNTIESGNISPSKFIPLAEEIGLINKLSERVMARVCREVSTLIEDGFSIPVSVNLSCRQFSSDTLVDTIERILAERNYPPELLKFEITESVFFEHQSRAAAVLNQFREKGIEIDIDDFGTGYSNLGYLRQLPISVLKIDRTFVSMIDEDGGNFDIVKAVITLAANLGLRVSAEGVETEVQRNVLRELGCHAAQGYLFARPMTLSALREYLITRGSMFPVEHIRDEVTSLELVN